MNNEATVKSAEHTPEAERIPEPINEDCSTQNLKTQPQISKLNMQLNDTKLSPLKKISTPEKDIAPLKKVTTTDVRKDIKHRKLCVLSNSTRRGILQAIEDNFASDFIYFFLVPTIPMEVDREIKQLKNTQSVGYDGVCTKVVKQCNFVTECCKHKVQPVHTYHKTFIRTNAT
ncbi:unnamed protein product [Parnassius apollo]|uniref:(apollo) hypothetical protein n=1 Tax=Parnassius apollo TaxID=110799 RepID=A0A8S3W152_PARAO|nr:unnamed protein product [Parnassius apollo]